jgi:hypothetical protein
VSSWSANPGYIAIPINAKNDYTIRTCEGWPHNNKHFRARRYFYLGKYLSRNT